MALASIPAAPAAAPVTAGAMQINSSLSGAAQTVQGTMPADQLATSFGQFFASAVGQTNALQLKSDEMVKQLATGQPVELHDVMIAMEKAGLAFQLTTQVRNKMVEAYQEVMRMQI